MLLSGCVASYLCLMGYGRLDTKSFFFFPIQVEMYLVACTCLKEQRIFTQNVFLVDAQTILEVIKDH